MTLFLEDGHLCTAAFDALRDGTLDELGALEVSEHLAFCDPCMEHYLTRLEGETLLEPETPVAGGVKAALRRKKVRVMFGRYATLAVAACLMVTLWASGFFSVLLSAPREMSQRELPTASQAAAPEPQESGFGMGRHLNSMIASVDEGLSNFFGGFTARPDEPREQQTRDGADGAPSDAQPDASSAPASGK